MPHRLRRLSSLHLLLLLLHCPGARSIHLPGLRPPEYLAGATVEIKANRLTSTRTVVPFDYYSLPGCEPHTRVHEQENLGEVLQGSVIQNTPYALRFNQSGLRVLCRAQLDVEGVKLWERRIREEYRVQLLLDNLPVVVAKAGPHGGGARGGARTARSGGGESASLRAAPPRVEVGYRLGEVRPRPSGSPSAGATVAASPHAPAPNAAADLICVHNHLQFVVRYHEIEAADADGTPTRAARLVGFEAQPSSRRYTYAGKWPEDFEGADGLAKEVLNMAPSQVGLRDSGGPLTLDAAVLGGGGGGGSGGGVGVGAAELIFTYDVQWVPSSLTYGSRWDVYMRVDEGSRSAQLLGLYPLSPPPQSERGSPSPLAATCPACPGLPINSLPARCHLPRWPWPAIHHPAVARSVAAAQSIGSLSQAASHCACYSRRSSRRSCYGPCGRTCSRRRCIRLKTSTTCSARCGAAVRVAWVVWVVWVVWEVVGCCGGVRSARDAGLQTKLRLSSESAAALTKLTISDCVVPFVPTPCHAAPLTRRWAWCGDSVGSLSYSRCAHCARCARSSCHGVPPSCHGVPPPLPCCAPHGPPLDQNGWLALPPLAENGLLPLLAENGLLPLL